MESQTQNPDFRNNPESFNPCKYIYIYKKINQFLLQCSMNECLVQAWLVGYLNFYRNMYCQRQNKGLSNVSDQGRETLI